MQYWILTLFIAVPLFIPNYSNARGGRVAFGHLKMSSMTDGAKVMIDGKEVGNTPIEEPIKLPVGKHTLKITKQGYTEYLDVFTIQLGKTTSLDIDLLPYAGIVVVTSSVPKARVFVDGQFVGTTPIEKEVLIGKHTLRVTKAGYYEYIKKFKSIAGKTNKLHVKLELMPVGTTPYRPPPPPPSKWYEKWYVWAGAASGVIAITLAVVIPVVIANQDELGDFCDSADGCYRVEDKSK